MLRNWANSQPAMRGLILDTDAAAFIARISPEPDDARKIVINNTFLMLKNGGGWGKDDAFYMTAAGSVDAARTNWARPQYKLTLINAPTIVTDRYIKGDGSTSYATSGFSTIVANNPVTTLYLRDDAHQAIVCRDNQASNAIVACGNSRALIVPRSSTPNTDAALRCNQTAGLNYLLPSPTSVGHLFYSRNNGGDYKAKKDGATPTTLTQASAGIGITGDFFICGASNTSNALVNPSSFEICHWSFGGALTDSEMEQRRLAVLYYLTAVGAF